MRVNRRAIASICGVLATAMGTSAQNPPAAQRSGFKATLDIYWVDVEGGGATLIVSPSGQSLLVDTGWRKGDRDARRIYDVAAKAGLKKIDYLVITHFHADHVGGIGALS